MPNPIKYLPDYSFTSFQANQPNKPLPAPKLDVELANIAEAIGSGVEALKDIRRSDGGLNGIVMAEALAPDVFGEAALDLISYRDEAQVAAGAAEASAGSALAYENAAGTSAGRALSSANTAATSATAAALSAELAQGIIEDFDPAQIAGAISSVNNKTGAVTLNAADVGAATAADGVTSDERAAIAANIAARHDHANKATLDAITAAFTTAQAQKLADLGSPADLYRRTNILGTVTRTGGVPTGAIIERGLNANGTFIRFADGTQICWQDVTRPVSIPDPYFSFYIGSGSWVFPAAFAVAPVVLPVAVRVEGQIIWTADSSDADATTSHNYFYFGPGPVSGNGRVRRMAIGRWF